MITCYFQDLYCAISSPTQFLQLSPRLEPSIVSMSVFFLFVCLLLEFQHSSSPLPTFPHFWKSEKEASKVHCLIVRKCSNVQRPLERKETMPEVLESLSAVTGAKDASPAVVLSSSRPILATLTWPSTAVFLPLRRVYVHLGWATPHWYQSTAYPELFSLFLKNKFMVSLRSSKKESTVGAYVFKFSILRLVLFKYLPEVLFEFLIPWRQLDRIILGLHKMPPVIHCELTQPHAARSFLYMLTVSIAIVQG